MTFVADEYREKKSEDDGNRRYPEWARFDGDLDQLGQDDDDGNGRDGIPEIRMNRRKVHAVSTSSTELVVV